MPFRSIILAHALGSFFTARCDDRLKLVQESCQLHLNGEQGKGGGGRLLVETRSPLAVAVGSGDLSIILHVLLRGPLMNTLEAPLC